MGIHRQDTNTLLDAPLYELSLSSLKLLGLDDSYCGSWGTLRCVECEAVIPSECKMDCKNCELECPCRRRHE